MTVGVLSPHYPDVLRTFRRRSPADSAAGSSAPPGSHAAPPQLFESHGYCGRTAMRLLLPLLILMSSNPYAEELQIPYISKGACPFECCSYGKWKILKSTSVYAKPTLKSALVKTLQPPGKIQAVTGEVHVIPGRAKVISEPHKSAENLDPSKEILILDYVGEGRSRVFQNGKIETVKIARTKNECKKEEPNWRYCWVEVLQEPESHWWVNVKGIGTKFEGWVLMDEGPLKPIDSCS